MLRVVTFQTVHPLQRALQRREGHNLTENLPVIGRDQGGKSHAQVVELSGRDGRLDAQGIGAVVEVIQVAAHKRSVAEYYSSSPQDDAPVGLPLLVAFGVANEYNCVSGVGNIEWTA